MKICVWFLFVTLLALPASGHDISIRQPNNEEDDIHRAILEQLRDRFIPFRFRFQYGVLYLAPPSTPTREVHYEPGLPANDQSIQVLYPQINTNIQWEEFQHNFAVANVDVRGRVYGRTLMNLRNNIHSEHLLVKLVYPRMFLWYNGYFGVEHANFIYIFTHYLPCQSCSIHIQDLQGVAPNSRIFVGYTDLYLPHETQNENLALQAQARRNSLTQFLNNHNGRLFLLPDDRGVCQQEGQSPFSSLKRRASESPLCSASTENREFVITMDFSTGKAVAQFYDIPSSYSGWIGLFPSATSDKYLAYEWTNGKTSGRQVFTYWHFFYHYISDGMQVRYFNGYQTSALAVTSNSWQHCGYDWTELLKLPYGRGSLKLIVADGKIQVGFKCNECNLNSYDWIAIQSMNQFESQSYWSYQWVSNFKGTNERWWNSSYRPNSDLSEGFRVKYVYYSTEYKWEGIYDNASPFWTANCRGTA